LVAEEKHAATKINITANNSFRGLTTFPPIIVLWFRLTFYQ